MLSSKKLVVLAIACLMVMHEVSCNCVCKEKGTDFCAGCNERLVVRPKQRLYEKKDVDLSPIGDNCWCSKLMIEPASLPKPPCPKHKTKTCGCNKYETSYSSAASPSYLNPKSSKYRDDSLAADPISVSLAVQAGQTIGVPEAKLSYGYVQKPVDGLKKVYFSTVPEENLYKLKNDIITLQKKPQPGPSKEEEEWMEIDEEEDQSNGSEEVPRLTYKQLGYVTEKYKNPKFRKVKTKYVETEEEDEKTVSEKVQVDCGFKPGRISPYRKFNSEVHDCYESA